MPEPKTPSTQSHTPEYTKDDEIFIRVDHKQKALIRAACVETGIAAASKGRELLLEWANKVIRVSKGGD